MNDSINDLQGTGSDIDVWKRILADAKNTLFSAPKNSQVSENWNDDEEEESEAAESERLAKHNAFKKGAPKGIKAAAWMWSAPELPY